MDHTKTMLKNLFLWVQVVFIQRIAKQPLKEKYLLTAPLELTNESYAVAKIAGVKLCESYNRQYNTNYICLMPSNLFGPNDNYSSEKFSFSSCNYKKTVHCKN